MKRIILTIVVAAVMISCVSCDRQKETTKSNRFPGFTQIDSKGELAKLYIDLNFAKRESGIVKIKFVRVVEGGYVIQEGITDCRTFFQGSDGVQYKDDGTSDRKYPGDATPKPYQNLSGIAEIVKAACNKANEPRVITGNFDDIKALELLYGTYRPELKAALWQGIAVPEKIQQNDFPKEGLTKPILSLDFQEGGVSKHMFLTATLDPNFSDCHACAPLIGGAIFVRVGDKWKIEREFPYLMINGAYGNPPELEWKKIGKDRYAFFEKSSDMHQGEEETGVAIWGISDGGKTDFLSVYDAADTNKEEDVSLDLSMIESNSDIWDAKVVITKKQGKSSPKITEQRYRFEGGKYNQYK